MKTSKQKFQRATRTRIVGASFFFIYNTNKTCAFQPHSVIRPASAIYSIASLKPLERSTTSNYGQRIAIDESFKGLEKIYSDPDIYIIEDFLDESSCQDLINKAEEKKLDLSPVAYAGKTDDKSELLGLAAKGPVVWLSIFTAWYQSQQGNSDFVQFGLNAVGSYAVFLLLAFAGITAFINTREDELQSLRTSTSTALDNLDDRNSGTGEQ